MEEFEQKRRLAGDLKQFAKAEMARDLATRHGRSLRLPWDAPEPVSEPTAADPTDELDAEALRALSEAGLGD